MARETYDVQGRAALDAHVKASNHSDVDPTCPVCVSLTADSHLIIGNDGFARSIKQDKAQRMSDGRRPGDFV